MVSNLYKSVIANVGVKIVALVVSFVSTPFMITFFSDSTVLGVWFTILSVLNWMSFFDFGIGNGLRNDLTYALASGDDHRATVVISSSLCLILLMVAFLFPALSVAAFIIDWNDFFAVGESVVEGHRLTICMTIVIIGTLIQLILKLVNSLLYASQRNAAPALLLLVSNTIILSAVVIHPSLSNSEDKLLYLCVVEIVALSLPLLFAGIAMFYGPFRQYVPRISEIDKSYFGQVASLGIRFFIIQLALLFVSSSNEFFIGQLYGSDSVVPYSVSYRVFNLILVFFGVMAQPIWSTMASSYAVGEIERLLAVHRKYISLAIVVSIGTVLLGIVINPFLKVWLSASAPTLTRIEAASLVLLVSITVLTNAETCLGNATNRLWPQVICYCAAAVAKFPLAFVLGNVMPGWASVVMSNALVLVPVLSVQYLSNKQFILMSYSEKQDGA